MTIRSSIKKSFKQWKKRLLHDMLTAQEDQLFLLGKIAGWRIRPLEVLSCLQDAEFKVTSQWGEDGIIDWLVERANIPPESRSFIEFGVQSYRESNTRYLLQNRLWRGFIMDGSPDLLSAVKDAGFLWKYDLTAQNAFITRENINHLITGAEFSGEIGLLSIDLDGNDYWIWEAIDVVKPILCVCEYNAALGDIYPLSIPYDAQFQWMKTHTSNIYYGASIKAMCGLARKKGYRFVGTTSAANDAFFVREDYASRFVDKSLGRVEPSFSRAREARDAAGSLSYPSTAERLGPISDLPFINTETGERITISDLGPLYSEKWLAGMMH